MGYKRLFIWVESGDDLRFFERIIKPIFLKNYDLVEVRTYANLKKEKFTNFIKSIQAMGAHYLCIADINQSPCISLKKQKMCTHYPVLKADRISIVIKEIEGWYLAGLSDVKSKSMKLPSLPHTNDITKEKFNQLITQRVTSRLNFMIEMLNHFSLNIAEQKNHSFHYFTEKYLSNG